MNPTDQWRKESRKKELKKNKKQRSAVREAVIKTKSAAAIIKEIEEIEQQGIESVNVNRWENEGVVYHVHLATFLGWNSGSLIPLLKY